MKSLFLILFLSFANQAYADGYEACINRVDLLYYECLVPAAGQDGYTHPITLEYVHCGRYLENLYAVCDSVYMDVYVCHYYAEETYCEVQKR